MKQKVKIKEVFIKNFGIILVLILSFWAIKPLLSPGFFPMHDDEQVGRLYELHQDIQTRHIPPRLVPNLGFGYGYLFYNYYPPFAYYVAEVFKLFGFGYIASIKLMIATGILLAALFMYKFVREYFDEFGSLIAAILYTYAPYHALDVYVRGALAEFWGIVFLPLVFWLFFLLHRKQSILNVLLLSIAIALFILSHNLVVMMNGIFLGTYMLFLLIQSQAKKKFFLYSFLSVLSGLAFSAYFWIPSFFEKKFTLVEILTKELANYSLHFVYLRQFWNSSWGYGGSIYGLLDGISFEVGKMHLVLAALVLISSIFLLRNRRNVRGLLRLFLGMFLLSLFLSSFYSKPIWDALQPFWYIQFPWRFLIFSTFAASFICGGIFLFVKQNTVKAFITCVAIFLAIVFNKDFFQPLTYFPHATDQDYINTEKLRWDTSRISFEYVPREIATVKSDIDTTQVDIDKDHIARSPYKVISGNISIKVIRNDPHRKEFKVQADSPSTLRINTYSYPGWKVFIDNKEVFFTDNNKLRLITLGVPKGAHVIYSVFTDTFYRRLGNYISLGAFIVLFTVGFYIIVFSRNHSEQKYLQKKESA